jgi:hypothetical protein
MWVTIYKLYYVIFQISISVFEGSVVVKALRCWSEGLWIDPQWCRWGFFPKLSTEPCALGVDSASKNEYQENSWG